MNQQDYESISFNGTDFCSFLNFVKYFISKSKSKWSKVVLLHIENDSLICRAVDDKSSYIEYKVGLNNTKSQIKEYIAVSYEDISSLVKSVKDDSDTFVIRKGFNQFEFNVAGNGWYPFNSIELDVERYKAPCNEKLIGSLNSIKLRDAITTVLGYTQKYVYPNDKFIVFSKNQMSVTSHKSSVVVSGDFLDLTLHRDDAAKLRLLLKDEFNLNVSKIDESIEYTVFSNSYFKYVIVTSDSKPVHEMYSDPINDYLRISCDELYKLLILADENSASKHNVGLSIKNSEFLISIKNNLSSKHNSLIKSEKFGNVKDADEVCIDTDNMLKTLGMFQDKHTKFVNIYITNELVEKQGCIIIFDSDTQAIISINYR